MAADKPEIDSGAQAFVERLRAVGARRYHDKHPFHLAMHAGILTCEQMQGWVANRYYYQKCIPRKDAAILSNLPDREKRRVWITRIIDHDGTMRDGGGGIELWKSLARAVGLDESLVESDGLVLPGTRKAVDSYVTFAREQHWLAAVASSLTELFAPELMQARITALTDRYPWIDPSGLTYFKTRLSLTERDTDEALRWVTENAKTSEQQDACVRALEFKCEVLWAILDAVQQEYGAGPSEDQPQAAPMLAGGVRFRRAADGQGVLLIPEGVVNLNESAASIVELIDGRRSVAAIAAELEARYGVGHDRIASDVEELLSRLEAKSWLRSQAREPR